MKKQVIEIITLYLCIMLKNTILTLNIYQIKKRIHIITNHNISQNHSVQIKSTQR